MTEPIVVRWRVLHKQSGMVWRWDDLAKALAQIALWEKQGDRERVLIPTLYQGERRLSDEEVGAWFAAAFQALTAQQEAGDFTRPEVVFDNMGNHAAAPTDSFLRNGFVMTTALTVQQVYPGGDVTLGILNSRKQLANGFIRLRPETLMRLAWWALANQSALLPAPKDGCDG